MLDAVLAPLCCSAMLEALRLDGLAGATFTSLNRISSFLGGSLRQLAMLDMQQVPHSAALNLVLSLPLLQV